MERIGFFGGSFNPPHVGHLELARSFLKFGTLQQLYVAPVASHPFQKNSELIEFEHRFKLCEILFGDEKGIELSSIEKDIPAPNFTYRTLNRLKERLGTKNIVLCMGGDSLVHFHKWYAYERIIELFDILIAPRPHQEIPSIYQDIPSIKIISEHHQISFSSTKIRKQIQKVDAISAKDKLGVQRECYKYIKEHKLYTR